MQRRMSCQTEILIYGKRVEAEEEHTGFSPIAKEKVV